MKKAGLVLVLFQMALILQHANADWAYTPEIWENDINKVFTPIQLDSKVSPGENVTVSRFELAGPGADEGYFKIEAIRNFGTVWQIKRVDYEQNQNFKLKVYAYDGSGDVIAKPVDYIILVKDINDNKPRFEDDSLFAQVEEKTTQVFHQIVATDADSFIDGNNVIFYSKVSGSEQPPGDRFSVSDSGMVQVVGDLDAENTPKITFRVTASDRNGAEDCNTVEGLMTVEILDANDHAPQFVGDEPYRVSVSESQPVGTQIYQLQARDDDIGINSEVSFEIRGGNDGGHFRIESAPGEISTGILFLEKQLDFESPPTSFILTVMAYNARASNANDPNYQTLRDVTVEVTDENEPPQFYGTPYTAVITEGNLVNQYLNDVQVRAIDHDSGDQRVTYSLPQNQSWFAIDSSDGSLSAIGVIDRESDQVNQDTSIFPLLVKATDPAGKSEVATVSVKILDVNDNAPEAVGNEWNVRVCNEQRNITLPITTITAIDRDSEENGAPFEFSLPGYSKFTIERVPDDVFMSARVFTYEERFDVGVVTLDVTVSDNGINKQTSVLELEIDFCKCDENGICQPEAEVYVGSASVPVIVGILCALLLLVILILLAINHQRRKSADLQKSDLLLDEDDVRDSLRDYHYEGGGEEDNDVYDMAALQPLAPGVPYRMDEKPLFAEPQPRIYLPPNCNIKKDIDQAKDQADKDPTAPPFDSLLVFDYEGEGSDAGSLSTLNSSSSSGSNPHNYDHLKTWGPRFTRIADAYGTGYDEEDDE